MKGLSKRRMRAVLSFLLAAVMLSGNPIHTLAANPAKEYVSDVRISTAKTADAAKKWLEDNGYQVQDQDLNEGTTEQPVYLGYKTTRDPKKAITDMAVMDMKGGYSFSDYEELLKQKVTEVGKQVVGLRKAVDEFAANYRAGSPAALWAFDYLNQMKEDDSNQKMGDYLIDTALTNDDLTKCFMQGNATIFAAIESAIAIGCADYKQDSWIQRMSDLGAADLSPRYDGKARKIYAVWDDFRNLLLSYQKEKVKLTSKESKLETHLDNMSDVEKLQYIRGGVAYEILSQYDYDDDPMIDFFLRDKEDLDIEELYPMAKSLTDGQAEILGVVGINALLSGASNQKSNWENIRKEYDLSVNAGEELSLYDGVDRSLFGGGVALTTAALRKSASTGDNSWIDMPVSNKVWYTVGGVVLAGVMAEAVLVTTILKGGFIRSYITTVKEAGAMVEKAVLTYKYGAWAPAIAYIAIGITLIVTSIILGMKLYDYYHPDFTEIPTIMVDERQTDDETAKTYVNYYAVKDQKNQCADLNAWEAKQWNALYITRDRVAGDPITTDLLVQKGNNTAAAEYTALHVFGEKAAFNLNKHCYTDKANGIYFFFTRDQEVDSYIGSAFSSGRMALLAGCSVVGGILIGGFGVMLLGQRKKKTKLV